MHRLMGSVTSCGAYQPLQEIQQAIKTDGIVRRTVWFVFCYIPISRAPFYIFILGVCACMLFFVVLLFLFVKNNRQIKE